jgi:hypothetical protein
MGGFSVHSIGDLALPVFAFYMLILSNFLGETLGCNLQKIMRYNMFAKHLVGYSLLLFLVIFSDEANRRPSGGQDHHRRRDLHMVLLHHEMPCADNARSACAPARHIRYRQAIER